MELSYHPIASLTDENGIEIRCIFLAQIKKGMGHEGKDPLWINYKRNHIQIEAVFQLDFFTGNLFVSHRDYSTDYNYYQNLNITNRFPAIYSQLHQIEKIFLTCNVKSTYNGHRKNKEKIPLVSIVQTSAKRDCINPVEPVLLFNFTERFEFQSFQSLDRMQFSRATSNNDITNDEYQVETFTLELQLHAQIISGETIVLGYAQSQPCVSRGRAPCHFEKRCPLHTNTASLKRKRAQRKDYCSITPPSSPSLKSMNVASPTNVITLERSFTPPTSP
jgi:hypothetical protein